VTRCAATGKAVPAATAPGWVCCRGWLFCLGWLFWRGWVFCRWPPLRVGAADCLPESAGRPAEELSVPRGRRRRPSAPAWEALPCESPRAGRPACEPFAAAAADRFGRSERLEAGRRVVPASEPAVSALRMLEEKAPTEKAPLRAAPERAVCAVCGRAEENEEELMTCGMSYRWAGGWP
jgi:hypothetical protein